MTEFGVPVAWLVSGLWALSLGLVAFIGRALHAKLSAMETALEDIAKTARELGESHARVEERLAAVVDRVMRLERIEERRGP